MTRIAGVLRADADSDPVTGDSPYLTMDDKGTIYAHVVSQGGSVDNAAYTQTEVAVSTVSIELVAANPDRKILILQNNSQANDAIVYLGFGAAAVSGVGFQLGSGQTLVLDDHTTNQQIFAIVAATFGPTDVVVIEGS